MTPPVPDASVVVPTFREAQNLRPLTERLFAATRAAGIETELIFSDDLSGDGSAELVESLVTEYPVRLIARTGRRGLAPAVLEGFEHAAGDVLVVMDADLQHPPEKVPELVGCIASGGADFVLGSRFAGGSIDRRWGWFRRLNSGVATALARPLVSVRDPMSGFFALHRQTWRNAAPLNPVGYKIALELMVKGRCRKIVEVPIEFGTRHAGESKLSLTEQLRYLRHLLRLYRFKLIGR